MGPCYRTPEPCDVGACRVLPSQGDGTVASEELALARALRDNLENVSWVAGRVLSGPRHGEVLCDISDALRVVPSRAQRGGGLRAYHLATLCGDPKSVEAPRAMLTRSMTSVRCIPKATACRRT